MPPRTVRFGHRHLVPATQCDVVVPWLIAVEEDRTAASCFVLVSSGRRLEIDAATEAGKMEWLAALNW